MKSRAASVLAASLLIGGANGAAAQPSRATVTVDASRAEAPISSLLYGQFAELMYAGVKRGIHAEMLRDRGFDDRPNSIGLPRSWDRYPDDRNDDYGIQFRWDDSVAYPVSAALVDQPATQHSMRIASGRGVVERRGLFQARIPVRAGEQYDAYLWAKTRNFTGTLTLALEQDADDGVVYAEARAYPRPLRGNRRDEWRQYVVALRPTRTDPLARFAILVSGTGTLWVDQVSLMPRSAVNTARADVFERVRDLKPAFIRWPGGNVAQDYHWQWAIGPRDRRPTWVNLSWGDEPEPGDFGTDEFIAFARSAGAEPSITVNVEGRGATVDEAAAWVEYCNGAPTTKFGAMRAANGHPQPYGVKLWEIGNEIWGSWVRGHSDAETYARNFQRYRVAMRKVDPGIRFIAVGDNDMAWNRTVLSRVGRDIDYLAIHHYYGGGPDQRESNNLFARPLFFERFYRQVDSLARAVVPGKEIRLAINEWGLDLPESQQYSMIAALYGARLMNVFERSAPVVAMSAVSDMVNGWPGGIIQAGRTATFVSPLYHVNRMYGTHLGAARLRTVVASPTFTSSREGSQIPALDAVASRSSDGSQIFIKLVNTRPAALETEFGVTGVALRPSATIETLSAPEGARNSFSTPSAVSPTTRSIQVGPSFRITLPARSVSVLTLHSDT